jgi:ankyrin repeat protein
MDFTQAYECPEYLLAKNQENSPENMKLFNAASIGSLTAVETCLQKGGKPNFFHRPTDQKNALHVASENGYAEVVKSLIAGGAVVEAIAASSKDTALVLAGAGGHESTVKVLLEAGADISAKNCFGNTALHGASRVDVPTTSLLLHAGADPNVTNNKGSTPLHFACHEEDDFELCNAMIELLLKQGATVDIKDARGATPLMILASTGNLVGIKLLLAQGADKDTTDNEGRTLLKVSEFFGHAAVSNFLSPKPVENTKANVMSSRSNNGTSAMDKNTKMKRGTSSAVDGKRVSQSAPGLEKKGRGRSVSPRSKARVGAGAASNSTNKPGVSSKMGTTSRRR